MIIFSSQGDGFGNSFEFQISFILSIYLQRCHTCYVFFCFCFKYIKAFKLLFFRLKNMESLSFFPNPLNVLQTLSLAFEEEHADHCLVTDLCSFPHAPPSMKRHCFAASTHRQSNMFYVKNTTHTKPRPLRQACLE